MKAISVGDLVVVVRPSACNGDTSTLGRVFRVRSIEYHNKDHLCIQCRKFHARGWFAEDYDRFYGLSRLKRIDPLSEPERVTTHDEVTA